MQTSTPAPLPANEERRLAALADCELLDTGPEEMFDAFTRLAVQICSTPIALIALIDRDRQWFKSNVGLESLVQTSRDVSFCAHTILHDEILEVSDALLDERFANNPLVTGPPHVRFYAGVPLSVTDGGTLGALCVMDYQPRRLTAEQRAMLQTLAAAIAEQFERRRAYLRLFDRSSAEFYEIDAACGRLTFANAAACRNTGYTLAELQRMSLTDVLPALPGPINFDEYVAGLRAAQQTPAVLYANVRRKDGTLYPVDLRLELIGTSKAGQLLGLAIDQSSRAPAAGRNAPSVERLTALSSVARNLFSSLEPRTLVDALVRGVAELTGGGTAQLLACGNNGELTQTHDLASRVNAPVPPDDFLRIAAGRDDVVCSPDALRAAVRILAPSGGVAYLLDIRAPDAPFAPTDIFAFDLLGQYLAVAIRNVELYGELESRRAAVSELNQVKNDLIAMLAHDFKGPLTTIVGLADVLAEDDRFDAESRQFLGMINSSATRLASLATDTLALSRLEQNELFLRFEEFNLVALLRDIVRVFSVTRGIDMRSPGEVVTVRGDSGRLRQVFENLIGNAIKYSPRGDVVDVRVREKRGGVEVAIRDRGIGIPQGDIPKLFGRFARGSNARELGIGGTGFGLYFARTIIERHGGQISIESTQGSGSTFRVIVPTVPALQRIRDRRILLLDSEEDGRSFVAHALRDEGYAVYAVADESEFLRALDEHRYDAAILDIERTTATAAELDERVGRRTKLVLLLGTAEPEPGPHLVLRKPFLIKDLRAIVELAVADRRRGSRRSSPER